MIIQKGNGKVTRNEKKINRKSVEKAFVLFFFLGLFFLPVLTKNLGGTAVLWAQTPQSASRNEARQNSQQRMLNQGIFSKLIGQNRAKPQNHSTQNTKTPQAYGNQNYQANNRFSNVPVAQRSSNAFNNQLSRTSQGQQSLPSGMAQRGAASREMEGGYRATPMTSQKELVTSTYDLSNASSSTEHANEAIHKIPWNALNPQDRANIQSIIEKHTMYRRLPMVGGYCNPEMFDFVLCHPDVVIGLWEVLGYSQLSLKEKSPGHYYLQESSGTAGTIDVLYHDNELMIASCSGRYKGPLFSKTLEGDVVIILQTRYTEDAQREPIVICRLDSFIRINNVGADLVGRVFRPVIGKVADANFAQTIDFVNGISKTAEESPVGIDEMIQRISYLSSETKNQFMMVSNRVYEEASLRAQGQLVQYELQPKPNQNGQNRTARILSRSEESSSASISQNHPTMPSGHERKNFEHASLTEGLPLSLKEDQPIDMSEFTVLDYHSDQSSLPLEQQNVVKSESPQSQRNSLRDQPVLPILLDKENKGEVLHYSSDGLSTPFQQEAQPDVAKKQSPTRPGTASEITRGPIMPISPLKIKDAPASNGGQVMSPLPIPKAVKFPAGNKEEMAQNEESSESDESTSVGILALPLVIAPVDEDSQKTENVSSQEKTVSVQNAPLGVANNDSAHSSNGSEKKDESSELQGGWRAVQTLTEKPLPEGVPEQANLPEEKKLTQNIPEEKSDEEWQSVLPKKNATEVAMLKEAPASKKEKTDSNVR